MPEETEEIEETEEAGKAGEALSTPKPTPPKPASLTSEEIPSEKPSLKEPPGKKKLPGKWFRKIPFEILLSPGGIILIFFALIKEIIDLIPVPGVDNLWELPLELIFMAFLAIIAKLPWQSMLIPLIIERVPGINDIVPTWLIRMFF